MDQTRVSKDIFFPKVFGDGQLNHFLISLITYDRICIDDFAFVREVLGSIPKKYHRMLVNLPVLDLRGLFLKEPLESFEDEMKPHFIHYLGYKEVEYNILVSDLKNKTKQYADKTLDINMYELIPYLINDVSEYHFFDIFQAMRHDCGYFGTFEDDIKPVAYRDFEDVKFDVGQTKRILEINRLPDLTKVINDDQFDLNNFLELRDKRGMGVLRELIFKEENFNNADELIRDYNDMLFDQRAIRNKINKNFWGLSSALSLASAFSPVPFFSLIVAISTMTIADYGALFQSRNDKLVDFIESDLRKLIKPNM